MSTVAILGGGISGLSCAYYLKALGQSKIKYLFLLEKSPRFGGWIQTTKYEDGAIFEHGPRTMRVAGKPGFNAVELAEQLDLGSQVIPIDREHPASKKRFVLVGNKLHLVPNSLRYMIRTIPPFQKPLLGSFMRDLTVQKGLHADESVYNFGERHFGKEVANYVFDPMCRGICANDAKETSIRSLIPSMFDLDQQYGSIIKGTIKSIRKESAVSSFMHSHLVYLARKNIWRMWSLKNGLSELIDTLALAVEESGHFDLHVNAECSGLKFYDGKAAVTVDNEDIEVDHVFSTLPSIKLAPLVASYAELANLLSSINSVTVAVVNLEYNGFVVKEEGFGFLTPSFEDSKVLGIIFDSSCIPEHNGSCRTRITCMMGGKWFNEVFGSVDSVTEEQVLKIAVEEAKRHLQILDPPSRSCVSIHKDCIPQYVVGHYKKLESIHTEIQQNNLCLSVTGASYKGAGVPDCIYNARLAVEKYLENIT